MANVVNKTTMQYLKSVDTPKYPTEDWWINPELPNCEQKYWKNKNGNLAEMTQQEKDDKDAEIAAQQAQVEANAKDIELVFDKTLKAFAFCVLDEINILRNWINDYKTAVANASSLANLKSSVASMDTLNERTVEQLKNAVVNKYDSF